MRKHAARIVWAGAFCVSAGMPGAVFAQTAAQPAEFDPQKPAGDTRVITAPPLVYSAPKAGPKPNPTPVSGGEAISRPSPAVQPTQVTPYAPSPRASTTARVSTTSRVSTTPRVSTASAVVAPSDRVQFGSDAEQRAAAAPAAQESVGFSGNGEASAGMNTLAPQGALFASPAEEDLTLQQRYDLTDGAASPRDYVDENDAPVFYTTQYVEPESTATYQQPTYHQPAYQQPTSQQTRAGHQFPSAMGPQPTQFGQVQSTGTYQTTTYGHQFPSAMGSQPTQFAQPVSGTRVIIHYEHGHPRHHCDHKCSHYGQKHYKHGHRYHDCDDHCDHYRSHRYSHGHHKHLCDYRCDHHRSRHYYHGHQRHLCDDHCDYYRRYSYRHGHHKHVCGRHCDHYQRHHYQRNHYSHGHARHVCGSHCSSYFSISYGHGHPRHRCDSHCSFSRVHFGVGTGFSSRSHYHYDHRRAKYMGGYRSPIYSHSGSHHRHRSSGSSFHFGISVWDD